MPPHLRENSIAGDVEHMHGAFGNLVDASGKLSLGEFREIATLGRGNMGTVRLVELQGSDRLFAMKIAEKDASRIDRSRRSRLERDILSMLNHPFLPSLHTHFESENYTFLVMDFCPGGDLNVLRHRQPDRKFSEAAVQFYGAEVLLALEYLHKIGIIYRDLKPENILIQEDGHVMLTDFDLSIKLEGKDISLRMSQNPSGVDMQMNPKHFVSHSSCFWSCYTSRKKTEADSESDVFRPRAISPIHKKKKKMLATKNGDFYSFVGTVEYVAPEILRRTGHGFSIDWWTFGIFLYEMAYGTTPFKGQNRKDTFIKILTEEPQFPACWSPLKDLITKLLVKDPSNRLGSNDGAYELKNHPFFVDVRWDSLQHVFRPPFVPPPYLLSKDKFRERKLDDKQILTEK